MTADPTRLRLEASGRDPEEALHRLSGLCAGREWWAGGDPAEFRYRYAALGDEQMTLRTSRVQGLLHGAVPSGDDLIVQWLIDGRGTVETAGETIHLQHGRPHLFGAHEPYVFDYEDYDQKIVHLDRALVRRVAVDRGQAQPGDEVRFDRRRPPSVPATALWLDAVGLVSRTLQRGPVHELLWSELRRMTASAFLELYAPKAVPPPEAGPVRSSRVRAANDYAREHAAAPISPADLAGAAGVSVRGPAAGPAAGGGHVARGRDPGGAARARARGAAGVRPAAHHGRGGRERLGFVHLGRFAAQYAARFGQPPSATLRG